jgi:hypothetical protein
MAEKWKVSGTYFEGCNCTISCPCIFLNAPTEGECTLLVGWHIEQGSFGNVALTHRTKPKREPISDSRNAIYGFWNNA